MTDDVVGELAELDHAAQALFAHVDDLTGGNVAHAIVAVKQLADHVKQLRADLEDRYSELAEPGLAVHGDVQAVVSTVPKRTDWRNDDLEAELRRHVVFDQYGDERSGSAVFDRLAALQPIRGCTIAGSKAGADRLAAALNLDSARDLDEWCTVGFSTKVQVYEHVPRTEDGRVMPGDV